MPPKPPPDPPPSEKRQDRDPGARSRVAGDVEALIEDLAALAADPDRLLALDETQRQRLREAAGRISFPDRVERRALSKQRRQAGRTKRRRQDDAALAATGNRRHRRALRFPTAPPDAAVSEAHRRLLDKQAAPHELPEQVAAEVGEAERPNRLHSAKHCYVCKVDYTELHPHYDCLCPECGELNWRKREQTADLTNRVALVTGARVKIGFEACLKLLRAGATVVATTRFPADAATRFAAESDFSAWRDRLQIHALDMRHAPSVEALAEHLARSLPRLDYLIHNACQTVRRPPAYYAHMMERERATDLPVLLASLVRSIEDPVESSDGKAIGATPRSLREEPRPVALSPLDTSAHAGAIDTPGMSQIDLLGEADLAPLFPHGLHDGEGQQLDLREGNSWRMELSDVPTIELIEVQLVNQIAPFILTSRLKPLMMQTPGRDQHVVNVSAMEGQFYRALKTTRHPHTNMAKAALNMMTRTSGPEFAREGIHMNSVDTGWVTDEDPFELAVNKEGDQRFVPPLDAVDGAARVLDPIFTGLHSGVHCWGQFLKDYRPTRW